MTLSEAKKYHTYACECLRLAEAADRSEDREKLVELARICMGVFWSVLCEAEDLSKACTLPRRVDRRN